jgi:hypothetical protein
LCLRSGAKRRFHLPCPTHNPQLPPPPPQQPKKKNDRYLAEEIGRRATQETAKAQAVPTWVETKRDFEAYAKRKGDLPLQKEGETIDFRNVLHRYVFIFVYVNVNVCCGYVHLC